MVDKLDSSCIMTIFGGTGDLAHRKLFPALHNLVHDGILPDQFAVVGVGRRVMSHIEYRNKLLTSVEKSSRYKIKPKVWELFSSKIYYYSLDFNDSSSYNGLKAYLENIDEAVGTKGNRIYYLSVAPSYFETITHNLKNQNMAENFESWQRIIIEKPFGHNLTTAKYLNKVISEVFPVENIFRIDHYLGKEMLQNLNVIRFGNAMFESIWNSKYIDNIQITSSETVGLENRAEYYESSGTLKDMFQNHMLQLLALVAMEPPASLDARSISNEKVKFLQSLSKMEHDNMKSNVVRGQYGGGIVNGHNITAYRNEPGVSSSTNTDTFIAMKLMAGNFRWGGMPFYLRTGKRMPEKTTNIVLEFKSMPEILYFKEYKGMQPNLLEIRIQPDEGVSFSFNAKKPGTGKEVVNVKMDFCQSCTYDNNSPESYERLLGDALRNDQTLFTSWEEIEASWSFVDNISDSWQKDDPLFPNYDPGTWGPQAAEELLTKDGRHWWNLKDS